TPDTTSNRLLCRIQSSHGARAFATCTAGASNAQHMPGREIPVSESILLPQILLIVIMARVAGSLLQMLGQPAVSGESAAGIVLGPLVLGALAPGFHEQLFGRATLAGLQAISSLGLVLFMFATGCELRPALRNRELLLRASLTGVCSFLLPFGLGALVGAS